MDEEIKSYFERKNAIQDFRFSYGITQKGLDILLYLGGENFGPESDGLSISDITDRFSKVAKISPTISSFSGEITKLWNNQLVDKVLSVESARERFVKLTKLGLEEYTRIKKYL